MKHKEWLRERGGAGGRPCGINSRKSTHLVSRVPKISKVDSFSQRAGGREGESGRERREGGREIEITDFFVSCRYRAKMAHTQQHRQNYGRIKGEGGGG